MISKLRCKRCYWEWIQRKEQLPRVCPKCKSPYYDKDRKEILNIRYLDIDDIIEINKKSVNDIVIKKSDKHQILSYSTLMKILLNYKKADGDIYDKAVVLFKDIIKLHPFASANRRTAFASVALFLEMNYKDINVKNIDVSRTIIQGMREDYYADAEIKKWFMCGEIRDFNRR